jgi:hypothetical protein
MIDIGERKHTFDLAKPDVPVLLSGFSFIEPNGRWTEGESAELMLPIIGIGDPFLLILVEVTAFISGDRLPEQQVIVSIDGSELESWTLREGVFRKRAFVLERKALRVPDQISIGFHVPHCAQPAALNLNMDPRFLGIKIRRITVEGRTERPDADSVLWQIGRRTVGTEAAKTWDARLLSGFWSQFIEGTNVLDIGFRGYGGRVLPIVEGATGVDLDYPGYDGRTLPFANGSQDAIFSSHTLEHIPAYVNAIQEWFRVTRVGGHIITIVPNASLYERRRRPPSPWNGDHQRFYSPSSLLAEFEASLVANSYRVRLLEENDDDYDYRGDPMLHPVGCYEIVLVIEKIEPPAWSLSE